MTSAAAADRDRRTDIACARAAGWTVQPWVGQISGTTFYSLVDPAGKKYTELGLGVIAFDSEQQAWAEVPHFSTAIDDAWILIDHVVPQGWDYELSNNGSVITCVLIDEPYRSVTGTGATPEEAICAAFLAAMNKEGVV